MLRPHEVEFPLKLSKRPEEEATDWRRPDTNKIRINRKIIERQKPISHSKRSEVIRTRLTVDTSVSIIASASRISNNLGHSHLMRRRTVNIICRPLMTS